MLELATPYLEAHSFAFIWLFFSGWYLRLACDIFQTGALAKTK
jgi:hypothetical protein